MRFIDTLKSRNGKQVDFDKIQQQIDNICKDFNLNLLYLYGSYASGNPFKLSDIDLGFLASVELTSDRYFELLEKFQEVFEDEAIDLVDLKHAPLTLIHRVLKWGKCLYAVSLHNRIEFEAQKENLYLDTALLRKDYTEGLIGRIKNGSYGRR